MIPNELQREDEPHEDDVATQRIEIPGRVDLLRGFGNAIVPELAAEFIGAYLDVCEELKA